MNIHNCHFAVILSSVLWLCGCSGYAGREGVSSCKYARFFDVPDSVTVVTISPFDGQRDTIRTDGSVDNIICMSSSHVAALSAIGADSLLRAVSGVKYITNPSIRARHCGMQQPPLIDIGYENSLDYEAILSLDPDVVVTYTVSGSVPAYVVKLRSLGLPVLVLHDHLEEHPLARAEYVRLFGVLTGRLSQADSVFNAVSARYEETAMCAEGDVPIRKVLLNAPYGDAWYVPGAESYMSRMIRDAGGVVLGAEPAKSVSRVISVEQAYRLSNEADLWLNPGHCRSRNELASLHQLFPSFGPLSEDLPIYNNTLRTTPEGGNDFWESGAMRPDLVLVDLKRIFRNESDSLTYFFPLK